MAYEFQVAVDCADPHALADWWAETLGWQVEPSDEAFIRRMISAGHATDSDTTLHNGMLVSGRWREDDEIRSWFGSWELVEPGLVPIVDWRPQPGENMPYPELRHSFSGGVARKR